MQFGFVSGNWANLLRFFMKKYLRMTALILVLASAALSQSGDYDISPWWEPDNPDEGAPISVAVDGKGSVFVFRRVDPSVLVFGTDGELSDSWGNDVFNTEHSIDVDREGFIWITDREDNMVYKFTADGEQLMTLGVRGISGDNNSSDRFDGPSDVAIAANGDIFVSDGYRNSRIVHFSKEGRFIKSIGGTKGPEPGQFDLVHGLVIDSRGRLIALDMGNDRIQVFQQDGTFLEQWTDLGFMSATGITIAPDDTVYIGDADGESVLVIKEGRLLEVIRGLEGRPHQIAFDPATDALYMADFSGSKMLKKIARK